MKRKVYKDITNFQFTNYQEKIFPLPILLKSDVKTDK